LRTIDGDAAATLDRIANLSTSDAVKKLGEEGDKLVRILRGMKRSRV
jgi:hypothetical protein